MSDFGADPAPNLTHARQLAYGYNFAHLPNLKIDQFPAASSAVCFTFVQYHGKHRLKILVNPDELPF